MEEKYDMDALYLYPDEYEYKIGKIKKVNDKSIRMQFDVRIQKNDFKKLHKLTCEETEVFERALIRKLSNIDCKIRDMLHSIRILKKALSSCDLVEINTDRLQKRLDFLSNELTKQLQEVFEIDNETFRIQPSEYDDGLEKVVAPDGALKQKKGENE